VVGNWTLVLCSVASRAGFVELDCYVWVTRGMPTEAHSTSKLVGTRISEDEIVAKMGRQFVMGLTWACWDVRFSYMSCGNHRSRE
jgi:hypothetical protein